MALTEEEKIYNEALGYVGEYQVEEGATTTKQYLLCSRYYAKSRDMALASHPWNEAMKSVIIVQDAANPVFGYDRRYSKPSDMIRVFSVDDSLGADERLNQRGVYEWEVEGDYILSNAGETPPIWATDTRYIDGQFVSTTPRTWVTATSYIDGEYVTDGTLTYEVLVDHTSDTIANDIASSDLGAGVETNSATYEVATTHTSDTVLADVTAGNLTPGLAGGRIVYVKYVWRLTDITKFSPNLKEAVGMQLAIKIITGLTNDTKGKVDLINEFERLTMPKARSVDGAQGKPKPIFSSEWLRSRTAGTWRP